jgi:hypothetical protein
MLNMLLYALISIIFRQLSRTMIMAIVFLTGMSCTLRTHQHLLHRRFMRRPLNCCLPRHVHCVSVQWRSFVQCQFQILSLT